MYNPTTYIYAIAIATNLDKEKNMSFAINALKQLGMCIFSNTYLIPCRDNIGADYWNNACLLYSQYQKDEIEKQLQQLESESGRKRPSHDISLDIDLIAFGENLQNMQFNTKKLPLANDVIIPLHELWQHDLLIQIHHDYPIVII